MLHSYDIIFISLPDREAKVGRGWTAIRGYEAAGRGSWPRGSSHPPRVTAGDAAAETRKYHITACTVGVVGASAIIYGSTNRGDSYDR